MNLLAECLSPGHARYLEARARRIHDLRDTLDRILVDAGPVTLEIGCGHGHFLAAYAQQYPARVCLGVDLVTKRIERARRKAGKRNLSNVHFLKAEIGEVLSAWPEQVRTGMIFILFPDPWPKKRHVKNRVLQQGLLNDLARISNPGTTLYFRSDHAQHFSWSRNIIDTHPNWHVREEAPWPFENPSYFQNLFREYQSLTAFFQPS